MTFKLRTALAFYARAAAGLLVGCGSTTTLDEPAVESRTPVAVAGSASGAAGGAGAGAGSATGTEHSRVATVDLSKSAAAAAADAAALAQRTVYFEYDSFVVKDEFRPMLEAHAKALAANRSKRVVLEGHTDERGGREYNLALGQKRAESVLKSMLLLGVLESQLEAVSFGEERPASPGTDEASMAKNRRVEVRDR
jgi:peptidoglycan-associated lipoprotein